MKIVAFVSLISVLAFGQQAPGIYVTQGGTLTPLTPVAYSGTQLSNKMVKASIFWTFRGSHSPVQLSTNRPQFRLICGLNGGVPLLMLCGPTLKQPTDLIVVRLDEKSDHREARTIIGTLLGSGHSGFDSKKTTTATATKRDDGSWDVSLNADLKSGEYLITTGDQPQGFDFGIQK